MGFPECHPQENQFKLSVLVLLENLLSYLLFSSGDRSVLFRVHLLEIECGMPMVFFILQLGQGFTSVG